MRAQYGSHTRTVYAYHLLPAQRKIYYGLLQEESIQSSYQITDTWLRDSLNPHAFAPLRAGAYTRFTIMSIVRCFLRYADAEFASDSNEAVARARDLYLEALDLLNTPHMQVQLPSGYAANPLPQSLRLQAELNLFKIRSGRNFAGMQRQLEPQTSQPKPGSAVSTVSLQPTPYRYSALIERTKQLVTIAQQMESAYLSALEKRDAEAYNLLRARQQLGLAQATVQLQDLRVNEANSSVSLAQLQQQRAMVMQDTYQSWITAGPIQAERDLLKSYREANDKRNFLSGMDAALTTAQAITSASSGGFLGLGISAGIGGAVAVGLLSAVRADAAVALNNIETKSQEASLQASYERRLQEWNLHWSLAQKDVAIGQQQIRIATDHVLVTNQEQAIAQMQANNEYATVDFLANKFTNVELYEWMSGVLGRVYSYFLQQATAVARLAQNQLAFERQEKSIAVIQNDYWKAPSDGVEAGNAAPDRRGMTGSARLLQDIYQLDQYAFETNKRKLQLVKTISLASLAPVEFQRFRQSGVLPFATPVSLFDQDFPGHYLRLIKRVRVSVVGLIPPNQGIKATLSSSGVSRVTLGDQTHQTAIVRHDPEMVALTSPLNATGLFELDTQADLLLPFEGQGVDTAWELQMPRPANPFDFNTLADVLLTLEYTALNSYEYRQQVIQRLDRTVQADRAFSFRQYFPDQWYELNNPAQSATPMTVTFKTERTDFPPNLEEIKSEHVVLFFARADGATFEVPNVSLCVTPRGGARRVGAPLPTVEGTISTRRSNAQSWKTALVTGVPSPVGTWELILPNNDQTLKNRFANGEIVDILLVISYSGRTPEWPM